MLPYHLFKRKITFDLVTITIVFYYIFCSTTSYAQDLENIRSKTLKKVKKNPVKINGGVSANMIYYNSPTNESREPFTYFFQGNLNVNLFSTFNMPLSYSFSNQGSQLDYQHPFKFNRLSLHPKYKWVQAHIGDATMNFSSYTLAGHQFTGGGVELTPKGPIKISAMGGRLLKATEDDGQEQTLPAFQRIGYGTKLAWEEKEYSIGVIGFYAKDDINSISFVPDEREITPQENLVIGFDGSVTIAKDYTLSAEYASSAITQDLRSETIDFGGVGIAGQLFNNRGSTEYYQAYKANLDMQLDKMKVGLGYEYVDPNYETLGAYFFNNDFENITVNVARPLFKDLANITFNIGYQRDNLKNQKKQATSRMVGAVNASVNVTKKITLTGAYSNFSTYTNASLNQFDDINDSDLTDEDLEALEYKQLSQNSNINLNWVLTETEKLNQNVNLNYNLSASANVEDDIIRVGQANNFHNANAVYTLTFPQNDLSFSPALNYNYSDIGTNDSDSYGGTLTVGKKFFEKKLNTTYGATYNTTNTIDSKTDVFNFRATASLLVAEKHNFNLNAIQLFSNTSDQNSNQELTVTFGYTYAFNVGYPKFKKREKEERIKEEKIKKEKVFGFHYKEHSFEGTHEEVTAQITELQNLPQFDVVNFKAVKDNLGLLEKNMRENEDKSDNTYKKAAIHYLDYLHKHKNFIDKFHRLAYKSLKELHKEAVPLNYKIEKEYLTLSGLIKDKQRKQEYVSDLDLDNLDKRERKFKGHTWMLEKLESYTKQDIEQDTGILKEFKNKEISNIFWMFEEGKPDIEIENYLVVKYAEFFHKKSLKNE